MIVRRIELDDGKPVKIVAEMTIEEAGWITAQTGSVQGTDPEWTITTRIFNALAGGVFNRFWSDGVDGFLRGDDE